MKKFFLILIGFSSLVLAEFTVNGDIVTDEITKLQWQDNSDANQTTKTWINAIKYCEDLTIGGFDDWRLPNINELLSITDKNKAEPNVPAIKDGFRYLAYDAGFTYTILYWSSTTPNEKEWGPNDIPEDDREGYYTKNAITVNFKYGDEYYYRYFNDPADKNKKNHVRCVRGGN